MSKTKEQCLEIAARIWCDQDMRDEVMNGQLGVTIANLLHGHLNKSSVATSMLQQTNPWLGRKHSRVMLEKLNEVFMEAWGDDADHGTAMAQFNVDEMNFINSCTVDHVDSDAETITIRLRVPPPEHTV